ncbi:MAG: molybdenum cofactor guanylyltransferase [Bacteroidetes bacterium]|nr:molybdenum cofactor guanylyltransferase [Bacteroidota bacterium]
MTPSGTLHHPPPEGLLLIGGRSSRFLPDKMQETLDGRPMYRHGMDLLAERCDRIWLSAGQRLVQPMVERVDSAPAGVRVEILQDQTPDQGPLEGIRAAMARSSATHLLVLAGDMPRIQPSTLVRLIEAPGADVVCARDASSGRLQPLCGRWSTALLPRLVAALEAGDRGVMHFLASCQVVTVDVRSEELLNVNRPSDLPGHVSS